MSETAAQIATFEQEIANAEYRIKRAEAVYALEKVPSFKRLILTEWMGTEAARLIKLSGDVRMKPEDRADCVQMAQAAGHLERYLEAVKEFGETAKRQLPELQQGLIELRSDLHKQATEAAGGSSSDTAQ